MHIVDALEAILRLAKRCGYRIRQEWLGGSGSGGCEIRGQKFLFLDISLGPEEQFDQVLSTLKNDANLSHDDIPESLRPLFATASHTKHKTKPVVFSIENNRSSQAAPSRPLADDGSGASTAESALRHFTADGHKERKTA